MRTVAWSHAVLRAAGQSTSDGLARALSAQPLVRGRCDLDAEDFRRYLDGKHSPITRLAPIERIFPGTRVVFDVGPENVPLWEVMSASSFARYGHFVEALMPNGRWPAISVMNFFCEDDLLARLLEFCDNLNRYQIIRTADATSSQVTPDLTILATAIQVFRFNEELGRMSSGAPYLLMKSCLALPGVQDALTRYGLASAVSDWVVARLRRTNGVEIDAGSVESTRPWMSDRKEFLRLQRQSSHLRLQTRTALWTQLFHRGAN